jgi:hypothetical protein
MSSTLASSLLYGPSIDLGKDQLGFYLNRIIFNDTFPARYIWQSENPVSTTGFNSDFRAVQNQNGTNTSMPARGGGFNNVWLFNGANRNNFYASDLAYTAAAKDSAFTAMIYFEYSATGRGRKIFGFQNAPPWTTPTNYDRNFYVGNNNWLYYGMYDIQTQSVKTVTTGEPLTTDKYYVAFTTYSAASGLKLYIDGAYYGPTAAVFNDDKTTVYPMVGGGFLNSAIWPQSTNGINYWTGGIKAMGIWIREFTQTEVRLATNYVRSVNP